MRLLSVIALIIAIGVGESCRCRYGCCRRYPFLKLNACCRRNEECVIIRGYGTCTPKTVMELVRPILEILPKTDKDLDPEVIRNIADLFNSKFLGQYSDTPGFLQEVPPSNEMNSLLSD